MCAEAGCAARRPGRGQLARTQRGLSIIELMVGLVVALIISLAASASAVLFTASQRQGIGVGGAAVNVNTVLSALKNDAASGGLGFFGDARYLCQTMNLGVGSTLHWDGAAFAPVRVTADAGQDRVDVLQSTRIEAGAHVRLALPSDGTTAALDSYLPAVVGDVVLLSPAVAGDPCTVRTVTAVVDATDETPQMLSFAAGGGHNDAAFTTVPTYADGGGGVTLLGQVQWQRYRMIGTDLVLERPLAGTSAVLASNVMAFRAQYGVSAAGAATTTLEQWVDATGAFALLDAANITRVRAVRIGVVVRSPQIEKRNAAGQCEASSEKPRLFGTEVEPDVSDWQCWRYRSAVVVVPMRNAVLGVRS